MTTTNTTPGLMKPGEVAEALRVQTKTVGRWAREGRLTYTRTPGGHRRYFADEIANLIIRQEGEQR